MSTFTLAIDIALTDEVTPSVTETAAITPPTANQITVHAFLLDADDFRKGEIYRGWDMLFRGWKSFGYDPFPGSIDIPDYFAVPLATPTIAARIITTNEALIIEGMVAIGIGGDLVDTRNRTLLARTAFQDLRNFYLETRKAA